MSGCLPDWTRPHSKRSNGAPKVAADLWNRASAEPPPAAQRIALLQRTARAEVNAGRETALLTWKKRCGWLLLSNGPNHAEVAEAYAALFRWVDAVDATKRGLVELGHAHEALALNWNMSLLSVAFTTRVARPASRGCSERRGSPSSAATHAEALAGRAWQCSWPTRGRGGCPSYVALSRTAARG